MQAVRTYPVPMPFGEPRILDGHQELALAEALASGVPRPDQVTRLLVAHYQTLDGKPATPVLASSIASGGRARLLLEMAVRLKGGLRWFETRCPACDAPVDVEVPIADLTVAPAGRQFPSLTIETQEGPLHFDCPNGWHESAFAHQVGVMAANDNGLRTWVSLCALPDSKHSVARLAEADVEAAAEALEAASPEVADETELTCPDCEGQVNVMLDPLTFGIADGARLFDEAHLIASAYGWREDDILALSSAHRRHYAERIQAGRRGVRR